MKGGGHPSFTGPPLRARTGHAEPHLRVTLEEAVTAPCLLGWAVAEKMGVPTTGVCPGLILGTRPSTFSYERTLSCSIKPASPEASGSRGTPVTLAASSGPPEEKRESARDRRAGTRFSRTALCTALWAVPTLCPEARGRGTARPPADSQDLDSQVAGSPVGWHRAAPSLGPPGPSRARGCLGGHSWFQGLVGRQGWGPAEPPGPVQLPATGPGEEFCRERAFSP